MIPPPKFPLGRIAVTFGALNALADQDAAGVVASVLFRHRSGDWGELCDGDKKLNNRSLKDGNRLMSAYTVAGTKLWVITEWDRSVTTVLLPEDY